MTRSIDDCTPAELAAFRQAEVLSGATNATAEQRQEHFDRARSSPQNLLHLYDELAVREGLELVRKAREASASPQVPLEHWVAIARREIEMSDEEGDVAPKLARLKDPIPFVGRVTRTSSRLPKWLRAANFGSICIIALLAVWIWAQRAPYMEYTAVDGPLTVNFRDGSDMRLATHAVAKARYLWSSRDVQLLKGEADFHVSHDGERPFDVNFGAATARALGTRFHVRRGEPGTQREPSVAVIDGLVRVTPAAGGHEPREVSAGGEAVVKAGGRIEVLLASDHGAAATSSSSARVSFDRKTLAQIAAAVNARNHAPRLIVEGTACGRLMSVSFLDIDNPRDWVALLGAMSDLVVSEAPDGVKIRERKDRSKAGADPQGQCSSGEG